MFTSIYPMKEKYLITFIIFTLTIGGCSFGEKKPESLKPGDINQNNKAETILEDLNYVNNELFFKIDFPDSFLGYKTKILDDYSVYHIPVFRTVLFGLETSDINWPRFGRSAEFFRIMVFNTSDWKELVNSGLPLPVLLETTDKYVYSYYAKTSFPLDINIKNSEILSILNTFEITEGNKIKPIEKVISDEIPQGDD